MTVVQITLGPVTREEFKRKVAWNMIAQTVNELLDELKKDLVIREEAELEQIAYVRREFDRPLGENLELTWDPREPIEPLTEMVRRRKGRKTQVWVHYLKQLIEKRQHSVYK
jgi:hypothetical protein